MLIDTHCHLDDPSLRDRLPAVLAAADRAGVGRMIVPGVHPADWDHIAAVCREASEAFPAFGLHPMHAGLVTPELLADLDRRLSDAVAVGEIGLDYTYDQIPREVQQHAFREQLRLAARHGLPVMIHCRKAFGDILTILREERTDRIGGIMHAFSGSPETARECLGLGLAISVSGTITFANAVRPVEVVRQIPLEHLVLETDAPDMTPEPYRGSPNEPAFLLETARKVAEIKGVTVEEVSRMTTTTAIRLLRLPNALAEDHLLPAGEERKETP